MSDASRAFDDTDEPQQKGVGVDRLRAAWGRRKWLAILVFAIPVTAIVTLLASLPNLYRSTATVLVDRQQVPEAFVRPTVTSELEIRLNSISQEILSRSRLEDLIRRFGLYADLRGSMSNEEIVERLRRDIRLDLKATDQRSRGGMTTVAFALSYQGRDPQTVALVTNTLASFYIDENLKARERQATGTADFLRIQLADAKRRLDEQERQFGDLRRRYMGELPQQMQSNLATLDSLNNQLRLNNDNQQRLAQQRATLAVQLGAAESASGVESDAVRLSRLKQELITLRTKYTDRWPDIIRIKDEIVRLEEEIAKPKVEDKAAAASAPTPEVVRLREAVKAADTEIRLLKADEQRLRRAIAAFETRVENTPRREQEFQEVTRDYESTKAYYQSLLKRYEEATLAESMEQRQKGEQFRILDPAVPAANPAAPNRFRLLLVGVVLSLGLAGAALVLAEVLDTSFHSVLDLRAFGSVPILARIPSIVTERDGRRRRWRFRLAVAGAVVGLFLVSAGSYLVGHGNEQLVQLISRGDRA